MRGNILLIDDDPEIERLLELVIMDQDYHLDVASTGTSGLQLSKIKNYDLIALELALEELSGIEVIKQLVSSHYPGHLCILTANTRPFDHDLHELKKQGLFFSLFMKPVSFAELKALFIKRLG